VAERSKIDGMYFVGSPVLSHVERFKELRGNTLLNVLFNLTEDEQVQNALLPQLSRIAFHDFWMAINENSPQELTGQQRTGKENLGKSPAVQSCWQES